VELSYRLNNLLPEYEKAYLTCHLHKASEQEAERVAEKLRDLRQIYEEVEDVAGVPWWFAGILHYLEWSFRDPERFRQEAEKLLISKKFNEAKTRTIGSYLWGFDLWNGFRDGAGDESEWVWGGTSIIIGARETEGSDSPSSKLGAGAIVKYLKATGAIDIADPDKSTTLRVLESTVFKTSTQDSGKLPDGEKIEVAGGTTIQVIEDELVGVHVRVLIPDGLIEGQRDRNEWYIYKGHIGIEGTEKGNVPNDPHEEPATKIDSPERGNPIELPKVGTVYLGEPILPGGHFSWAEATKNGTRKPVSGEIVDGIKRVAEAMEDVRAHLGGHPIQVNSWYRDPVTNKRVGGASKSRHLVGDAVDFVVDGIPPMEVNNRLEAWWGNKGGLASASSFTHLDTRGYRARWTYGF